jgi:hypothetical protein
VPGSTFAEMEDYLDGRARFGFACGVVSLLAVVYHPVGLFLGPLGVVFSLASLVSVDEPPTTRTRRVAAAGTVLAASAFVFALAVVLSAPQSGE